MANPSIDRNGLGRVPENSGAGRPRAHKPRVAPAARLLNALVRAWPALTVPLVKLRFDYMIPFNRRIGMRLASLAPDNGEVTLRLPLNRGNYNAANTVHGGAILALAESVHGVVLAFGLRAQHPGVRIFTKEARLKFIKKATADLFVSCSIDRETLSRIGAELRDGAATELWLESSITDRAGTLIAELAASYHISGPRRA